MAAPPRFVPRWPGLLAGVLAGLLFFAFAALPFLFVWGWSGAHCEPKPDCQTFAGRALLVELAVILALAGLAGTSVVALVDWALRRRHGPTPAPRWAAACAILLGLLGLWLGASMFP